MTGRWASPADEHDYIADVLSRAAQEIGATADQSCDPEQERQRAKVVARNAAKHWEIARRLLQPANPKGEQVG